ncbi:MBL fold metallo-hydrolase [Aminobacter sp. NyZ550]|uniref:MBL fold metallo-hydrolase n=1 Tax=Aminobacter sp. NyZ550 TaxID=2979870 RepID=UPI0021D611EA|nr:MBL fold metallo-hydrolase [Aminobacter sp. NyZ550]WAX93426.1 MBL fold metallo-hydrolase [Aminobacter sp. NyZ550]
MADVLRLTILGCGSSPGTPRITGDWGACDPTNPKNRRTRAAAMVERISDTGVTRVVIDTGPDFRAQMLAAGVRHIDGAVYTHPHADHIHGIDDLRGYVLERGSLVDIWADVFTLDRLKQAFGYCIETPPGSSYPPIVRPHAIAHDQPFVITGEGGALTFLPLPQIHGDIISLGFRVGPLAYCSDVSDFPDATVTLIMGLELLVVDALQHRPHVSHLSLSEALEWIGKLKPSKAVLTHMHVPLDYAAVMDATPAHVEPAYDGMTIEMPFSTE